MGSRFGTLPPTAVTHGESSHAAVSGVAVVFPHCAFATARFCTTPQSPLATITGMPAAAADSRPGSCALISALLLYVLSPVPSLIDMASAKWWAPMNSSACINSGIATWLGVSSTISLSAGVAEIKILAYGAIRWAASTSSRSSPTHASHEP